MFFRDNLFNAQFGYAVVYARIHHQDQMYGDEPYITHLMHVAMTLVRFGYHPDVGTEEDRILAKNLIIAAILHDVIEDTDVTREALEVDFNKDISTLVWAVSNEPGKNRRERHAKSYHKIVETKHAITLKLADRIANIEHCHATDSDLIGMYRKEWAGFKEKLLETTDGHIKMWEYLERLLR